MPRLIKSPTPFANKIDLRRSSWSWASCHCAPFHKDVITIPHKTCIWIRKAKATSTQQLCSAMFHCYFIIGL